MICFLRTENALSGTPFLGLGDCFCFQGFSSYIFFHKNLNDGPSERAVLASYCRCYAVDDIVYKQTTNYPDPVLFAKAILTSVTMLHKKGSNRNRR
jgi:hypothetical protein